MTPHPPLTQEKNYPNEIITNLANAMHALNKTGNSQSRVSFFEKLALKPILSGKDLNRIL